MRYFLLFFFLLLSFASRAQTGHYFLQHYSPGNERLDHVCFDIVQDDRGIMYFATRAGILRFDGHSWDVVEGNGAIYALETNSRGEIFWAGARGFGKLQNEKDGTVTMTKLSSAEEDVYQALAIRDRVYFLNNDAVFLLGPNNTVTTIKESNLAGSTALFELFDVPYVSTEGSGNYKIDQNKLAHSTLNISGNAEIVFSARLDDTYLLGTSDHKLYLCSENLQTRPIKLEDEQYINASVFISGAWVNKHLVALGTLRGGLIFINPFTGRTEEIINYNTGLPDNEVFTLMCDRNKSVWAAHDYGFTRISPFLPFKSFSHYSGLQGNLLCAETFSNQAYAGTSLGLFKLVREELYEEITFYEDVKIPVPKVKGQPPVREETEKQVTPDQQEKKKGFLRFLKRRNKEEVDDKAEYAEASAGNLPAASETPAEEYIIKKIKKTEKILRSAQYVYKKVKGIEAKITHLTEVNGKLIASGLAGVFEVNDLTATNILEEPARSIFSHQNNLLIATYEDNLLSFEFNGKKWNKTKSIKGIDDQITFIFKTENELWLCALDKIYRVQSEENGTDSVYSIPFPNPNFSKIIGLPLNSSIVIVNGDGFFQVDRASNSIQKIDSLPSPKAYFASAGSLWYHDNHSWNVLGKIAKQTNIHLLNLFPDLRFVASGQSSENLWVITSDNQLYKFYGEKLSLSEIQYPLFVKSIRHADKKISSDRAIKINQEEGTLTIELVKPFFAGEKTAEYRYYLQGLDDSWSEWSTINEMNFPYLPAGSYTLLAQSRDAFGTYTEMTPIEIEVLPPYWRRPWFYAMEFALIAMLVLASFRLSSKFRFISRLLSLLTIILLIEFIQTVAGYTLSTNSSPVIDFIIQVVVALMVLPIEGFLRNLMFKSIESKSKIYQIITGTEKQSAKLNKKL